MDFINSLITVLTIILNAEGPRKALEAFEDFTGQGGLVERWWDRQPGWEFRAEAEGVTVVEGVMDHFSVFPTPPETPEPCCEGEDESEYYDDFLPPNF